VTRRANLTASEPVLSTLRSAEVRRGVQGGRAGKHAHECMSPWCARCCVMQCYLAAGFRVRRRQHAVSMPCLQLVSTNGNMRSLQHLRDLPALILSGARMSPSTSLQLTLALGTRLLQ